MNDEKWMFFTERIQNTLVRPEILRLMKDETEEKSKVSSEKDFQTPVRDQIPTTGTAGVDFNSPNIAAKESESLRNKKPVAPKGKQAKGRKTEEELK